MKPQNIPCMKLSQYSHQRDSFRSNTMSAATLVPVLTHSTAAAEEDGRHCTEMLTDWDSR